MVRYFNFGPKESNDGAIRGSAEGSYYILEPRDDGKSTNVVAVSVADPNGVIPKWLINWIGLNMPHNTMMRLREHLGSNEITIRPEVKSLLAVLDVAE